jgi:hypothetical protein
MDWTPLIRGHPLPPYRNISDLISREIEPRPFNDEEGPWSRDALGDQLERALNWEDDIWECILAIWRFKIDEERGGVKPLWQDHISAWMVRTVRFTRHAGGISRVLTQRHSSVCRIFAGRRGLDRSRWWLSMLSG